MKTAAVASTFALIFLLLSISPSDSYAQMSFFFRADSTMDGNAGTIFRITNTDEADQEAFVFEEDGKNRVYALREVGGDWFLLTPAQYYCPVSSMTIGETWRFINDNMTEETVATVALEEEITVPAGTFQCFRVDIARASDPGTVNQQLWFSFGAGMVMESYFEGNGYWISELDDYFVSGTGFMPRVVGNWWTYAGYLVGTEETSWGKIKSRGR